MIFEHLLPRKAIRPNLELKTRPKQPLGSPWLVPRQWVGLEVSNIPRLTKFGFPSLPDQGQG